MRKAARLIRNEQCQQQQIERGELRSEMSKMGRFVCFSASQEMGMCDCREGVILFVLCNE